MKKSMLFLMAMAFLFSLSMAQTASSDIYGTVVLADGSPVPGVAITLTSDVTGEKVTISSEEGNFRVLMKK